MKNLVLLTILMLTSVSAIAAEPLLLEPLSPTILNGVNLTPTQNFVGNTPQVTVDGVPNVEVIYTTKSQLGANMVPQNAVAEGKPAPEKRIPGVKVQTKQRSQGNSYWNAGGKGTKSFF